MPEFDVDHALAGAWVHCTRCGADVVPLNEAHDERQPTWRDCQSIQLRNSTYYGTAPRAFHVCPKCGMTVKVDYVPVSTTLGEQQGDADEMWDEYMRTALKPECPDCSAQEEVAMWYPAPDRDVMTSTYECDKCGCGWEVTWAPKEVPDA